MPLRQRQNRWLVFSLVALLLVVIYFSRTISESLAVGRAPQGAGTALVDEDNGHYYYYDGDYTADASSSKANASPKKQQGNYTVALVIAKTAAENVEWLTTLPPALLSELKLYTYTVDDPFAPNKVPRNKGHEAMVYLTHIIDHYHENPEDPDNSGLSNVTMFMHAHQVTWHNNDILDSSALMMIEHLRRQKVVEKGYVNMRCHHDPGCPAHLHPGIPEKWDLMNRPEESIIAKAWEEIFGLTEEEKAAHLSSPYYAGGDSSSASSEETKKMQNPSWKNMGTEAPSVLSQPCCSQFAVSSARIRSIPLSRYLKMRKWLETTDLDDRVSGRVFEYVWQKLWLGLDEYCPDELSCYCGQYGVCFEEETKGDGGRTKYAKWMDLRKEWVKLQTRYWELAKEDMVHPELKILEEEEATDLRVRIDLLRSEMAKGRDEALETGRKFWGDDL